MERNDITISNYNSNSTANVISLEDKNARCESLSGGKGASLAQMITILDRLDAEIPKGTIHKLR